jgi:phage baseplate assembly protein W
MKKSIFINDISLDFDAHPLTGRIPTVKNEQAIKQSLKTLILLNAFEKPYLPNLYTGIPSFLFEQINAVSADQIKERIEKVVSVYEPRVILDDVLLSFPPDDNYLNISITYRIIGQTEELDTLTVILGRAR